ncbi:MAG: hypothetical protein A4E28_00583 [Methanocella sp. PtaU1.Bin125]|nr:MAG: hypothetical protein A4E28_00583 [Methanocella sp. PtaU1.Bin125]
MRVAIAVFVFIVMIACAGQAAAQGVGTITGVVTSSVGSHAVPDAIVTLYDMDGNLAAVPENPQYTSNGTGNNAGIYMFYDVPFGTYNVTAAKGDSWFFAIAEVGEGTVTANVVLPEYVETEPAYRPDLGPSPVPKPYFTYVPIKVGTVAPPSGIEEGLPVGLAVVGGIGALLLYGRRHEGE